MNVTKSCLAAVISILMTSNAHAQKITQAWFERNYTKTEVMIPMRDGVRLYTAVYEPVDSKGDKPVLLERTPYGLNPYGKGYYEKAPRVNFEYLREGYVLVYQNVRGTYLSEGDFVNIRPVIDPKGLSDVDDATDLYDTAEWLLANVRCNGNIGVKGNSYNGFYSTIAALAYHPAVKAVCPQAPVTDWFIGDDVHRNGIFQASIYGFGASMFRTRKAPTTMWPRSVIKDNMDGDMYDYFLERASMTEFFAPFKDTMVFFNDIRNHPDYDDFWKQRNPTFHFDNRIKAAVMVVGGWYDAEDGYGSVETFRKLVEKAPEVESYFVEGPWYHGGWNKTGFDHLGTAWFGTGASEHYLSEIEFPFFEKYLAGKDIDIPKVQYLPSSETSEELRKDVSCDEEWKVSDCWPPKGMKMKKMFLGSDGSLSAAKVGKGKLSYISDPSNPVPYSATKGSFDRGAMVEDVSFLKYRPDILTFTSEVLEETLKLEGPLEAVLDLSISTADADVIVKLIDVCPDGRWMTVRFGALPVRYRGGIEKSVAAQPGKRFSMRVDMDDIGHHFLPGHRLMVQIQSSFFPFFVMNPQSLPESQYASVPADYISSEVTFYSGKGSYILLPVVE